MLITTRAPLRVSFFGGGTDYPEYFVRSRGAVVGMAIDKYIYVSALRLSSIIDYRYRLSYSRIEKTSQSSDLEHPVVREAFRHYGMTEALDLSIMADLPSRSGLGSSSCFTVALLKLIAELRSRSITTLDLAREAIFVERELLRENVGVQDQYHAAFGGLNRFEFEGDRVRITPIPMKTECLEALTSALFLVYTGVTRFASDTLTEQMKKTTSGALDKDLSHLLKLTDHAVDVLENEDPEAMLRDFGAMLHEGWETKKKLSSKVSNLEIDALYEKALAAGALGGKLCGAGSGGFLLMLVPPTAQTRFKEMIKGNAIIPIGLDTAGATVITR